MPFTAERSDGSTPPQRSRAQRLHVYFARGTSKENINEVEKCGM
jgi:hypothetical protein